MIRVLYGLWNYPQLSETYVEAEVHYALSQGIEVQVWSGVARHADLVPSVPVHRGTLTEAIAVFKPHVFHAHYLAAAPGFIGECRGVPVTIRGHSFDWNPGAALALAADPRIRKIWLFPHFAAQVPPHPKIVGLPVAYSSRLYGPHQKKDRELVLRTAAGRPDKGLGDFLTAAKLCPDFRFVLCVAEAGGPGGGKELITQLKAAIERDGNRVDFRVDVSWPDVAKLTAQAGIYLDTSDPAGHPFGMPISIAESMATGSYVLARTRSGAAGFLGDAGELYSTAAGAAVLVNETRGWRDIDWMQAWERSVKRSEEFKDWTVLKPIVDFWKSLSRDGVAPR